MLENNVFVQNTESKGVRSDSLLAFFLFVYSLATKTFFDDTQSKKNSSYGIRPSLYYGTIHFSSSTRQCSKESFSGAH